MWKTRHMQTPGPTPLTVFLTTVLLCPVTWQCNSVDSPPVYVAPVTFTGIVNDSLHSMPGNISEQNHCYVQNDTIFIRCCTKNYRPARGDTATGKHFLLHILPRGRDTLLHLTETECILHFFSADRPFFTSIINPADSTSTSATLQITPAELGRRRGARIDLTDFSARDGSRFEIRDGRIRGTIQY